MTCSDAAKKKSEEQGCACRPDCVTRSVLEKLETRISRWRSWSSTANGVDVGDGLSSADRIVIDGGASRRRRRGERGDGQAGQGSRGEKQGRSARSAKAADASDASVEGQGSGTSSPQAFGRRHAPRCRRCLAVASPRSMAGQPSAWRAAAREVRAVAWAFLSRGARERIPERRGAREPPGCREASSEGSGQGAGRTRRRHRSASAPRAEARGDAAKQAPQKPDVPSVASQVADGDVKVSRWCSGDGGGARRNGVAGQERPKADAARDDAAAGEGQAPKKRRRRRPRKPKGSAPGSQPPASED